MAEGHGGARGHDAKSALGDQDRPAAHGTALGAGGVEGWWAWKHRRRTRRGVDAVSPATGRGTILAVLWFAGLAAITVAGPALVGWPRPIWFGLALVVMVGVALLWDRRSSVGGPASDDPA